MAHTPSHYSLCHVAQQEQGVPACAPTGQVSRRAARYRGGRACSRGILRLLYHMMPPRYHRDFDVSGAHAVEESCGRVPSTLENCAAQHHGVHDEISAISRRTRTPFFADVRRTERAIEAGASGIYLAPHSNKRLIRKLAALEAFQKEGGVYHHVSADDEVRWEDR